MLKVISLYLLLVSFTYGDTIPILEKGINLSIQIHKNLQKKTLPISVDIKNEASLINFAYKELHLEKENVKLQKYLHYIVIHYENEEYIKKHPQWAQKKYLEAMVINSQTLMYNLFRASQT